MSLRFKHSKASFLLETSCISSQSLRNKVEVILKDIFSGFKESTVKENDITFLFTDDISSFVSDYNVNQVDNVRIGNKQLHFKDVELNFIINHSTPFQVIYEVRDDKSFQFYSRIFNKAFKDNLELQITVFYYRIFLLFTQIWNVKNNDTYIHASAVADKDGAILFTADSGIGKSSLLFRVAKEGKHVFLADDLTILSRDAIVYYQGRSLSIRPYHLRYFPFLRHLVFSNMPKLQRLQWMFLRDSRLNTRISPNILFKKSITSAKLKKVIHLCNHDSKSYSIQEINSNELINMVVPILNNEFFLAFAKLDKLASLPEAPFQSSIEIMKDVIKVYESAFIDVDKFLVSVPYRSDPNELYDFLNRQGCLN